MLRLPALTDFVYLGMLFYATGWTDQLLHLLPGAAGDKGALSVALPFFPSQSGSLYVGEQSSALLSHIQ